MKLILSSCDFLNDNSRKVILNNLDKDLPDYKVLFIPNEKANSINLKTDKYYNRLKEDGFVNKDNIYIFDEEKVDDYRNLDIDLIYISGGNTFATMNKLRKTDFLKDIKNYIKNGVIYIGGSAGAHIVGENIEHVLYFDSNDVKLKDYNGLKLFKGIIIVHYDDSRKDIYNKLIKKNKYKVYTLTNDQSIVVNDDEINIY